MSTPETINWIPVSKRLPDDEKTVLICGAEGDAEPVWLGYHAEDCWHDVEGFGLRGVTHWSEMPEGPKHG